jgi:hypothetical protein
MKFHFTTFKYFNRISFPTPTRHRMSLRIFIFFLLFALCTTANDEQICRGGQCYPRIFLPTGEFQLVKEGQEIPAGNLIQLVVSQ